MLDIRVGITVDIAVGLAVGISVMLAVDLPWRLPRTFLRGLSWPVVGCAVGGSPWHVPWYNRGQRWPAPRPVSREQPKHIP